MIHLFMYLFNQSFNKIMTDIQSSSSLPQSELPKQAEHRSQTFLKLEIDTFIPDELRHDIETRVLELLKQSPKQGKLFGIQIPEDRVDEIQEMIRDEFRARLADTVVVQKWPSALGIRDRYFDDDPNPRAISH